MGKKRKRRRKQQKELRPEELRSESRPRKADYEAQLRRIEPVPAKPLGAEGRTSRRKEDKAREHRIRMEIIVDAYGEQERAMGWYYYLEEKLGSPFTATCIAKRAISPLRVGDEVEVIGMAPEDECEHEMFVMMRWERDGLAVPLSQLRVVHAEDDETWEAVEDWHYWVEMGYQF